MATALSAILNDVMILAGQTPGSSVQTYSEETFKIYINTAIRHIFKKYFWLDTLEFFPGTLDGVTGTVTEDWSDIKSHEDIKNVFYEDYPDPLPIFSTHKNPSIFTGTSVVGFLPLSSNSALASTKIIRFYPITSEGNVGVWARLPETELVKAIDETKFDRDLVVFGTLFLYLEGEGILPQEAAKFKALFDSRYNMLVKLQGNAPIPISERSYSNYPREWTAR